MQTSIDWERVTGEATVLLQECVRIDTSNPPGNEARAVEWLGQLLAAEGIASETAERSPDLRARISNTISLTTINTGIKVNVIPAVATATLDCRLLPDVDPDAFLAGLKRAIDDERVMIEILNRFEGGESPLEAGFVRVVREVVADMVEGSQVVPELTSGFTDSRICRSRGILAGMHGHNERLSVDNLRLGIQVVYDVVRRLCAA